jgi:hypothetical protein
MKKLNTMFAASAALLVLVVPAFGQYEGGVQAVNTLDRSPAAADTTAADSAEAAAMAALFTPGLNMFEAPKQTAPFTGFHLEWHAAFAQGFQSLNHSTRADASTGTLQALRPGFNLAMANLSLGAQLARGIRVDLESYMSSRHHEEFWVKGGYATIDASPIDVPVLNRIMEYTTSREGHYEVNYGDAHYRRSDGGYTVRNPFVENYILDAFTTEIGADAMVRKGPAFVIAGVTSGQNKGDVKESAVKARPAFVGKIGFDQSLSETVRVRLTGSTYQVSSTPSSTLYGGDRTGSHYFGVMEKDGFVETDQFTSGRVNPGFRNEISAYQFNPFIEIGALEIFGVVEKSSGKAVTETTTRHVDQYAGDVVYRFLNDKLYVGGRYNVVKGDLSTTATDVTVKRNALSAGWFLTPNLLTKVEYVNQKYDGFPLTDIRNGGKFDGLMIEGAIAF